MDISLRLPDSAYGLFKNSLNCPPQPLSVLTCREGKSSQLWFRYLSLSPREEWWNWGRPVDSIEDHYSYRLYRFSWSGFDPQMVTVNKWVNHLTYGPLCYNTKSNFFLINQRLRRNWEGSESTERKCYFKSYKNLAEKNHVFRWTHNLILLS